MLDSLKKIWPITKKKKKNKSIALLNSIKNAVLMMENLWYLIPRLLNKRLYKNYYSGLLDT